MTPQCQKQDTADTYEYKLDHRRRMETEAHAKVVPCVWKAKFIQFLAALAVLPRFDLEKKVEIILFLQIDRGKTSSSATDSTTFAFSSSPSFFYRQAYGFLQHELD